MTKRVPLHERKLTDSWSAFESLLFNLVTDQDEIPRELYFSGRLAVTQAMLDAYDAFLAGLRRPN